MTEYGTQSSIYFLVSYILSRLTFIVFSGITTAYILSKKYSVSWWWTILASILERSKIPYHQLRNEFRFVVSASWFRVLFWHGENLRKDKNTINSPFRTLRVFNSPHWHLNQYKIQDDILVAILLGNRNKTIFHKWYELQDMDHNISHIPSANKYRSPCKVSLHPEQALPIPDHLDFLMSCWFCCG